MKKKMRKIAKSQIGNFSIFLSFRFYVKSIFQNLKVLKTAVFAILRAQNFVNWVFFNLQKVQKIDKMQNSGP